MPGNLASEQAAAKQNAERGTTLEASALTVFLVGGRGLMTKFASRYIGIVAALATTWLLAHNADAEKVQAVAAGIVALLGIGIDFLFSLITARLHRRIDVQAIPKALPVEQ